MTIFFVTEHAIGVESPYIITQGEERGGFATYRLAAQYIREQGFDPSYDHKRADVRYTSGNREMTIIPIVC